MNKVSRVLPDLKGQFISGICQTGEREIMLATCGRGGEKNSYLLFVNLDEWKIVKEKKISEDISAEFLIIPVFRWLAIICIMQQEVLRCGGFR